MAAYDRVTVEGQTLNRRTNALYQQTKVVYATIGGTGTLRLIRLIQGSYTGDVDASAGTHLGGGATDTVPTIYTPNNWRLLRKANRMCMFASWDRPDLPGVWDHHNHSGLLGDREMSRSLLRQVQDYFAGRNGLASHVLESPLIWRPPVLFNALYPLGRVNLDHVRAQARLTRGWTPLTGVKHMQRSLNVKMHAALTVDGIYGPRTRKAYARWELGCGGDGDGIPAPYALILLGAARFNVDLS